MAVVALATAAIAAIGSIWSSTNGKKSAKQNRKAAGAMSEAQKKAAEEATRQAREGTKQAELYWWMNTDNNLSGSLNNLLGVQSSRNKDDNLVPLLILGFVFITIILMVVTKKGN